MLGDGGLGEADGLDDGADGVLLDEHAPGVLGGLLEADALERPRVVVELATDLLTDTDLEDGFVRSAATAAA